MKKTPGTGRPPYAAFLFTIVFVSCTFDYGVSSGEGGNRPDIEMDRVEYTRVRNGGPQVRFRAEKAARWEECRIMELERFSFEQFANNGDVSAGGSAGVASVDLDSGNIDLGGGVSIDVKSEDITIETERIDWRDEERILSGPENGAVVITRSDGTLFQGSGITVNARGRTWEFAGEVSGSYIQDDDEEDEDEPEGETAGGGEPL
ncbi:MAG: LPS export ABC transporter periplasmic protein LptC [Treponema sp.]|jgi:LPS export ABC transporter protein LptC|nr:LPS export ABC transporter periplasmic protein LptC [Treponema sp.]